MRMYRRIQLLACSLQSTGIIRESQCSRMVLFEAPRKFAAEIDK